MSSCGNGIFATNTGFIAKFYIFSAAVSGYHWPLVTGLVIGSGIGIYYYLRVIFAMTKQDKKLPVSTEFSQRWPIQLVCSALIASILLLGLSLALLMDYIKAVLFQ